ncbi:MAG TPA: DUF4410 domain-containing protein [Terriglobales bacterium]|nr:DUF4410 domain-containing protein [Terriglobales bacterium]
MKHFVSLQIPIVVLVLAVFVAANHAQAQSQQRLTVGAVTTAQGVEVPADYVAGLQRLVIEDLGKLKKFEVVSQQGSADSTNGDLHLTWTITKFNAGSRAKRLFSTGFGRAAGVGATRMSVRVRLVNGSDSRALLDKEVERSQKGNSTLNPAASFAGSKSIIGIESKAIVKEIDSATKH